MRWHRDLFMIMVLVAASCGRSPGLQTQQRIEQLGGLIWTEQQELQASDKMSKGHFGVSVALSLDGNSALIGANQNSDGSLVDKGDAYVFVRSGSRWAQQQELHASDPATYDYFGQAIAISADGNTAIVGSNKSDSPFSNNGAAYMFVRSGTNWTQQQKLQPNDKATRDFFGQSVALSSDGNTALVGSYDKSDSPLDRNGAAYVFIRSGTSWTQQQKLRPSDPASEDNFGISVALSSDGKTAIIGANHKSDNPLMANGAAYVFVLSGTSWTQQQKLQPDDKASVDYFGGAVSLSSDGHTALIGAASKSDGTYATGAAYMFVLSGTSWTQQQKLQPDDKATMDYFGSSVTLSGDGNTALVGALGKSDAYVFIRVEGNWTQQQKFQAGGSSVALSSDSSTALIGAWKKSDSPLSENGEAYVFVRKSNGTPCGSGSECASANCVDGVCCDTPCGGGDPSDCQACSSMAGASVDGTCALFPATVICRVAAGACDLPETCTGSSSACPLDSIASPTTVCRAASGLCDLPETCTGSAKICPSDSVAPASMICRPSTGSADPAEFCNGVTVACPSDVNNTSAGCSLSGALTGAQSGRMHALAFALTCFLVWSRRRRSLASLLSLSLLGLVACNNEPLIVLDLDPTSVPTTAMSLRLLTSLDGIPGLPQVLNGVPQRIAVHLPDQPGSVQLELDAFDKSNCKVALAEIRIEVPGGLSRAVERSLYLTRLPNTLCTLTLAVRGHGSITSQPPGISCGSNSAGSCAADFALNTNVQLNAAGQVQQWMSCDVLSSNTCSVMITSSREITAGF